jgi:hypothetical protein
VSELEQAVRQRMAEFAPVTPPPPFEQLLSRKRARDRRLIAAAGSSLAVVLGAVTLAGLAIGFDGQPDGDRLGVADAPPAGPPGPEAVFGLRYDDGLSPTRGSTEGEALERCLDRPGAYMPKIAYQSDPPLYRVRLAGSPEQADALEACLRAMPRVTVTRLP